MQKININNFEEKLYYEKLPNGLEVFLVPMLQKQNYFCMFGTKYGGRNLKFKIDNKEVEVPSGIAHFLEHKLFEREDINPFEFYGKSGTDVNASTTSECTNYYFFGNNQFLDNLKYLLNWITKLEINDEKVKKEQGIILEEASMYKDRPDRILYERILNNVYQEDTRRKKVIGTDEDIIKITKEDLDICYKSFYRPDNMYIIAAGNINPTDTIKVIKEELKDFKNPKEKIELIEANEPDEVFKDYEEINIDVETPKLGISYKINKNVFKNLKIDKYNLDYYLQMLITLGFGSSSDFKEELLNKGLFTTFNHQITDTNTHYLIDFYASSFEANKLIKEIDNYVNQIKIKEEDFHRLKKTWIASEIRMIDSINATVYNILDDILDYNEFKGNKINDIKNLEFSKLKEVQKKLDLKNKAIVLITKNN